jgi:hypothetical protein
MKKLLGLLCVLLIAQASAAAGKPATAMKSRCTPDNTKFHPVVCIDDVSDPSHPKVSNKEIHAAKWNAAKGPVYITWKSQSGNAIDMRIYKDPIKDVECYKPKLSSKDCDGDSCTFEVNPDAPRGNSAKCRYDVWLKGGPKVDPVVIVDECCH